MISVKLATLDLLKLNEFWNKDYDAIISVHNVTYKTSSRESNYNVDLVVLASLVTLTFLWQKLS